MSERVLTGITTTGTPHLGNYVGAIRPAIKASLGRNVQSFFFLADYHALIKCDNPDRIERSRLEIAATWLACGLDTARVTFYRQSDIAEIPELAWLLTCVSPKGQMNRAHAYKAAADANVEAGEEIDANITMGLYCYPILMAADILLFNAHRVPVGRDQVQHIEMARDTAQRFNHLFGAGYDLFVLPQAEIEEEVATLPGLDGRKMSKSYDNTIPLFEGGARGLKDAVARIVTDSRSPGEPKDPDNSALATIYNAFATAQQRNEFHTALRQGLGWGEAKQRLVDLIEAEIGPKRAAYEALMGDPERVEATLMAGAKRARAVAQPLMEMLRRAVGLRPMIAALAAKPEVAASAKQALPVFKQYREGNLFYLKLEEADGKLLLQSRGFQNPREIGSLISRLLGPDGAKNIETHLFAHIDEDRQAIAKALSALADEKASTEKKN